MAPSAASPFHTLLAWSLAAAFLIALPQALIRPAWPHLLSHLHAALPSPDPWFTALAIGSIGTNLLLVLAFNLALLPVYASGAADAYRCDASKPWPWAAPDAAERSAFWRTVAASLLVVAFNSLAVAYAAIYAIAPLARLLGAFSMAPEAFPDTLPLALQLGACLVIEDFLFYCTHRALHAPQLYAHIHAWHHAFKSVIALSSENAHPIEYAVGNLLPVTLGPLLLRTHAFTFFWVRAGAGEEEGRGRLPPLPAPTCGIAARSHLTLHAPHPYTHTPVPGPARGSVPR
jgi:hypothetical protein